MPGRCVSALRVQVKRFVFIVTSDYMRITAMPDLKTSAPVHSLPRHLGVFGLWLLVVNGLIGAGIFGLPGGAISSQCFVNVTVTGGLSGLSWLRRATRCANAGHR